MTWAGSPSSAGRAGVWLHVDGAYGGFAVLTAADARRSPGLDLADSITLDPHKWLAMPFEVGGLMVRDGAALEHAFESTRSTSGDERAGPEA